VTGYRLFIRGFMRLHFVFRVYRHIGKIEKLRSFDAFIHPSFIHYA
jgi:hypothetical protein